MRDSSLVSSVIYNEYGIKSAKLSTQQQEIASNHLKNYLDLRDQRTARLEKKKHRVIYIHIAQYKSTLVVSNRTAKEF